MFSLGGLYYEILLKCFILNFFIRTLRGQYVFYSTVGLITVVAMISIQWSVIVSSHDP